MSIDKILHEASTVLYAAQRYLSELSEVGKIDHDIHRMRVLITRVAVHSYTDLESNKNVSAEVRELQDVKEIVLRKAKQRFGNTSEVLSEFHYTPK
jgi:hypothetical protein